MGGSKLWAEAIKIDDGIGWKSSNRHMSHPIDDGDGGVEINMSGAPGVKLRVVGGHQVAEDNGFGLQWKAWTAGGRCPVGRNRSVEVVGVKGRRH